MTSPTQTVLTDEPTINGEVVDEPTAEVATREPVEVAKIDYSAVDKLGRKLYDDDRAEQWYFGDKDWPYEFVEFKDDRLAVRKPQTRALQALQYALNSKRATTQVRMSSIFIENHLSEPSYDRVFERLMDPDEADYTTKTIGLLSRRIMRLNSNVGGDDESGDEDEDGTDDA